MKIEDKLRTIREHQSSAPVDTIPLAEALGLKVFYADWPREVSGKIERKEEAGSESGYIILVNDNHPPQRRRFTIAHEIAHFVLHQDEIGDGIFDDGLYRSGLPHKTEVEANSMAADILMPWPLIVAAFEKGDSTVEALARRFRVSNSAMSIRLGVPYEGGLSSD